MKLTKSKWQAHFLAILIVLTHLGCAAVFWVGFSRAAVIAALIIVVSRGLGITAGYHRYFAHRTYRTSRAFQFLLGLWGLTAIQGGPILWAQNHRYHHSHADMDDDIHSPKHGFWWSHLGWLLSDEHKSSEQPIHDLQEFPELRFLDALQPLIATLLIGSIYALGEVLGADYHTNGWQMLVYGFCFTSVILWNSTSAVSSVCHLWGSRRFDVEDNSRNNWFIALMTLGEGWHNNHHYYPHSARQGFYWWEFDPTYYVLKLFESVGLIWKLQPVPNHVYFAAFDSLSHRKNYQEKLKATFR